MRSGVQGLLQVALRADDLDASEAFYREFVGAAPAGRFDPPGLLFFRLGDVRLLLERQANVGTVYVLVDDVAATLARLSASGVEVVSAPHTIFRHSDDALGPAGHDEVHAFVRDPSGNMVGLVQFTPGAA